MGLLGDISLLLISLLPQIFDLLFGTFLVGAGGSGWLIMVVVESAPLWYLFAALTSIIQKYLAARLDGFRWYRLRKFILLISGYYAGCTFLLLLMDTLGLGPPDAPPPVQLGVYQFLIEAVGKITMLFISIKCYQFLNVRIAEGKKAAKA